MIRSLRCYILPAALALAALTCGGCSGVGWLAHVFYAGPKVDPLFEIPQDKSLLVLVDGGQAQQEYEPIEIELTEKLAKQLRANEVVVETVPYSKLMGLMAEEPDFNKLYINQIGQRVGADIVLYVLIEKFQLQGDNIGPVWEGLLETSIRLVDVENGRLWPTDRRGGYPVEPVRTPMEADMSTDYRVKLARRLADMAADRIAKCFYEHDDTEEPKPNWEQM